MTLPDERVRLIAGEIAHAGARSTQSSVHLHATFDVDDKASGAIRFCARQFGAEAGAALVRYAFAGDSGNDAACFAAFVTTFGVANVRASVGRLASVTPRYVASRDMGDRFAPRSPRRSAGRALSGEIHGKTRAPCRVASTSCSARAATWRSTRM